MAKLTVKLKQHTPLIHFQHEQDGATLRATELKPKLDKFIVENYNDERFESVFNKYKVLVDENFGKSNLYKIKVISKLKEKVRNATSIPKYEVAKLEKDKIKVEKNTPYFGDNLSLNFFNIKLEIFSFDKKVLELIKEILPFVFIYENFGTRQSKGFGSFTPLTYSFGNEVKQFYVDVEDILKIKYSKFYKKSGNLVNLYRDYNNIKGGTNIPFLKEYKKSKLMKFFYPEIRWEKAKIKHTLLNNHLDYFNKLLITIKEDQIWEEENYKKEIKDEDARYVRGLLGLAEHFEFKCIKEEEYYEQKIVIKIKDAEENKEKQIGRFQSPILFKIINREIYLLPNEIDEKLFGRKFNFILEHQIKKNKHDKSFEIIFQDENFLSLETPTETEFNLIEFLDKNLEEFHFNAVKAGDTNA